MISRQTKLLQLVNDNKRIEVAKLSDSFKRITGYNS